MRRSLRGLSIGSEGAETRGQRERLVPEERRRKLTKLGGRRDSASAVDTPRAPHVRTRRGSAHRSSAPLPHKGIVTVPTSKRRRRATTTVRRSKEGRRSHPNKTKEKMQRTAAASEGDSSNAERRQDRAKRERLGCLRGKSSVGGLLACCICAEMQRT